MNSITDDLFEKYYQEFLNVNPDKACSICHEELKDNLITLDCKHQFHYNCLINNKSQNLTKSIIVDCPYCRFTCKITNNNINIKPIINNIILCNAIIKNGIKKGNICNRKCKTGDKCHYHSK
jgi:hypothetical protein